MEKEAYPTPPVELIMSDYTIARVRSLLGSQGIVDALDSEYSGANSPEHPEDNRWTTRDS